MSPSCGDLNLSTGKERGNFIRLCASRITSPSRPLISSSLLFEILQTDRWLSWARCYFWMDYATTRDHSQISSKTRYLPWWPRYALCECRNEEEDDVMLWDNESCSILNKQKNIHIFFPQHLGNSCRGTTEASHLIHFYFELSHSQGKPSVLKFIFSHSSLWGAEHTNTHTQKRYTALTLAAPSANAKIAALCHRQKTEKKARGRSSLSSRTGGHEARCFKAAPRRGSAFCYMQ